MNATELSARLGQQAEAVCRRYLSNGRKEGCYWLVGDIRNAPGRSLYVRLVDGERAPAGKWTDAATGDHGDLLDVIARSLAHATLRETLAEARRFLALPEPATPTGPWRPAARKHPRQDRSAAARRLFAASRPVMDTLAARYLAHRGIAAGTNDHALRFHPCCHYRPAQGEGPQAPTGWPAMIAAITCNDGHLTGIHRTWLDRSGKGKAPLADPRRAMGAILGHAIRFGAGGTSMIVGEGIETVLSLRPFLPHMPLAACTSAAHLSAFQPPAGLTRLYVACDRDAAGEAALAALGQRLGARLEIRPLVPILADFNDDLREAGDTMVRNLAGQLAGDEAAKLAAS